MLASKPAPVPAPSRAPLAVALGAAVCLLAWLYSGNPRLWGSWHGFLHAAIATRFSAAAYPPENPFFAGERLPYYWVYHFAGYWLSRLWRLDLLRTFHAISWISLAVFVLIAARIGRTQLRSAAAGLAIAWLGLAGINPLGPAIAAAKHWTRGAALVAQKPAEVETTFISNQAADDLMTEPLLSAMYIGGDWRQGQDLVWFFDVGSRAPALAGLLALIALLLRPAGGGSRYAAAAAVGALVAALNPLVGLGGCGALAAAAVLTRRRVDGVSLAAFAGALAAAPTYWQIFARSAGSGATLHASLMLPFAVATANLLVLGPLALAGARKDYPALTMLATAGALLVCAAIAIRLPEGNEHNLMNAAQCLLAVPAGAVAATPKRAAALLLLFLPVTGGALMAFAARPPIPIAMRNGELVRASRDSGLPRLYAWIRRNTPEPSIFITDPDSPIKMSGNVSELPAFTGRTLFTDTPSYLTTPNRDAALRAELARRAIAGARLTSGEAAYLERFGRPVYVIVFRSEALAPLAALYGRPAFLEGSTAAFRVAGGRDAQ